MVRVVLFSTTTCSWCRRAKKYFKKKYFKKNRIPFKEINVDFLSYYATARH